MLVSVTERTREIGIRKAIGAKRIDIIFQFLLEAAVLTGLGGLAGLARLGHRHGEQAGIYFAAYNRACLGGDPGIVVSVGVGLFFGIWPANKAAKLDPVTALRYE